MPEPQELRFSPNGGIPNHPLLPALVYKGALLVNRETNWTKVFEKNGWDGIWEWSIFDYHHFHPDAHEALGVAMGSAELVLGGPEGKRLRVEAGDLLALPAGFGHKKQRSSVDFRVVGAYPPGQENYTIERAVPGEEVTFLEMIKTVPIPRTDPLAGEGGALPRIWGGQASSK